eukprot:CAMPEP_0201509622 /NCGR_PEP_ID=MMETSP0161_2-20130828/2625_1 /ASSEMBLY_ACC=CAM_ASM_000251 /TAXON_ID=180227 /ORGANISM="Neoparamoeba aestuarina, Strain SoJaBio B1-5/56/2" /LENGTH=139 /DNA_ID=CAMNT_0047904635 /DNA_START=371 /DNA_END=790 /DNA_ORIENTATION=-
MNTAAESAVPKLTEIFLKAIEALSLHEAKGIIQGEDTSAGTKYLQSNCNSELDTAVTPHIQEAMEGTGAHSSWEKVKKSLSKTPAKGKTDFDMVKYVVEMTLNGLFKVCAQFEEQYRKHMEEKIDSVPHVPHIPHIPHS